MQATQVNWFGVQAYFAKVVTETAARFGISPEDVLAHRRRIAPIVDARYAVVEHLREHVGTRLEHRKGGRRCVSQSGTIYYNKNRVVDTLWFIKATPIDAWGAGCVHRISYPKIAALFGSNEHTSFLLSRRHREEAIVASAPQCIRPNCRNFARMAGPVCGECQRDEASARSPVADRVHKVG